MKTFITDDDDDWSGSDSIPLVSSAFEKSSDERFPIGDMSQPPNGLHEMEQQSYSLPSSTEDRSQFPDELTSINSQSIEPPNGMHEQHSSFIESSADDQPNTLGVMMLVDAQQNQLLPNGSLPVTQPSNGLHGQEQQSSSIPLSTDNQSTFRNEPTSTDSQSNKPPKGMQEQHSSFIQSSTADAQPNLLDVTVPINAQPNNTEFNDSLSVTQPPIILNEQPLRPSELNPDELEHSLNEYTDDGHRCYSKLMRGDLPVHLGETFYILRDIPLSGASESEFTLGGRHTYKTVGKVDHTECDVFRVEQMWKDNEGNRFVFGHHYLRPSETYYKASKKFYRNELVKASFYEKLSIDLIMGRCWVLDPKTFCKGRPIHSDEVHVYICELKVNKGRRHFSKISKQESTICTESSVFEKFDHELKITRDYLVSQVDQ